MPGSATVIGRVAVKVVPDTGDFRAEAQRELSAIEKAIDKVQVDFTANLTEVAREADKAVDTAEKAVKGREIALKFDFHNQDELIRTINQIDRELDKLKERTTVHIDLDDEQHLRQLRETLEDELEKAKPNIEVSLNAFAQRKALGQMAYLSRTRIAQIVPHVNQVAAAKAGATLAALSGGRGLFNIASDFGEWVGNLDEAIPTITTASLAITNLTGYILAATSNTLAFGGSLASIGGTALALPGILGGMALGLGATIAVLKDFNKVLPGVGNRFHDLQDSMSTEFWSKAEEPFRNFITDIFPQFREGMEDTSSALGIFFGKMADSATGTFDGQLQSMFDDLADSIEVASDYTDNILSVLHQLGAVGAGNLPRLAEWFGEVTEDFDAWLKRKGPEGLQRFIDEGITALQDLGGVLSATGSMFAGLARAAEAAGGSTLAVMRDTMEGVADTVNSRRFQSALTNVFEAAHEGMTEISKGSGPQFKSFMKRLGNTLETVLPSAGRAGGKALGAIFDALDQPEVQAAAITFFEDIEGIVDTLAPHLPGVAKALSAIVETVGDVAGNLADSLAPALDILAPAIESLADDLDPLIDQLGELLENVVRGGAPVLADLAETAGDVAGAIADILKPVNDLLGLLGDLPGPVKGAVTELGSLGLLVAGGAWLGTAVRSKIGQFGGAVTRMGDQALIGRDALYRTGAAAQTVTSRLTGLRSGAAVGVLALSSIASEAAGSDSALSSVADIGGLALTGFFLGGPWGAAIGAGVGGLGKIIEYAGDSSEAAEIATASYEGLRDTLHEVTGATTAATRAFIYDSIERAKMFDDYAAAGLARRTVVDAIMGEKDALSQVNAVLAEQQTAYETNARKLDELWDERAAVALAGGAAGPTPEQQDRIDAIDEQIAGLEEQMGAEKALIDTIKTGIGVLEEDTKAQRERGEAITDYAALLKGSKIPDRVITRFEDRGIPGTAKGLARLAAQYKNLDNRKIRAIIEAAGLDVSMKRVKALIEQLDKADKKRARPKVTVETKVADKGVEILAHKLREIDKQTGTPVLDVDDKASKKIDDAKKKADTFGEIIAKAIAEVTDRASSKILDIREALTALDGQTATVTTYHRSVYSSENRTGGGPTPKPVEAPTSNREISVTARVGRVNLDAEAAAQAGIALARSVSWAMENSMMQRTSRIDNVFKQLLAEANSTLDKAYRKRFGARITDFQDDVKQMNKFLNGLRDAKARLQRLRDEVRMFKQAVIDSFMATADPTQLGSSFEGIVDGMNLSVERAQRFADAIDSLVASGLNETTLQQLITAGPDAALDAAEAIVSGGVAAINDAQSQIDAAAQQVGGTAGDFLFEDLIGAAAGRVRELVKALKPLQKELRKEARNLVDALTDELKKELKKAGRGDDRKRPAKGPRTHGRSARIPRSGSEQVDESGSGKTLIYNAAPGPQLTAEEQLFEASDRGRMSFP